MMLIVLVSCILLCVCVFLGGFFGPTPIVTSASVFFFLDFLFDFSHGFIR